MRGGGTKHLFSNHLFWDVSDVDWDLHRNFIISRVMDRGTLEDVRLVWNHYGAESVKAALLRAPALQRKTIHFFANQFHLDLRDFRSYRKSQELGTWIH